MPDTYLDQSILSLFESFASFDEFQNFGIDPNSDADFEDVEDLQFED